MVKSKGGVKKGPWTAEEDNLLLAYIQQHGHGSWQALPAKAGLKRCGKSCRLRWSNYLRPDIKRGKFTVEEERTIIQLHALLGNKWSAIATHLHKRTDNEIKNYWNTHLKKRLEKMGIDPTTHKPKFDSSPNLSHIAQWESARLEAEARLVRESKVQLFDPSLLFPHPKCPSAGPNTAPTAFSSSRPPRPKCLDILKAWQEMVFGLESPTSVLNFPESSFTSHNISNIPVPQLQFPGSGSATCQSANEGRVAEQVQETLLDANEFMETLNGPNGDEWTFSNELIGGENVDVLAGQNGNYWNSLLSMVDAPLSPSYHI